MGFTMASSCYALAIVHTTQIFSLYFNEYLNVFLDMYFVTSQTSYSPEYITPTQEKKKNQLIMK